MIPSPEGDAFVVRQGRLDFRQQHGLYVDDKITSRVKAYSTGALELDGDAAYLDRAFKAQLDTALELPVRARWFGWANKVNVAIVRIDLNILEVISHRKRLNGANEKKKGRE